MMKEDMREGSPNLNLGEGLPGGCMLDLIDKVWIKHSYNNSIPHRYQLRNQLVPLYELCSSNVLCCWVCNTWHDCRWYMDGLLDFVVIMLTHTRIKIKSTINLILQSITVRVRLKLFNDFKLALERYWVNNNTWIQIGKDNGNVMQITKVWETVL